MCIKLFERVKIIASKYASGQVQLGETIGLNGRTFQNYLNKDRQDNLWPLLPRILEVYPQIDRNWLYFGEGEILKSAQESVEYSSEDTLSLKRECELLRSQLIDKDKIISLYEKRELDARKNFTDTNNALGTDNAALLSHQGSEESQ